MSPQRWSTWIIKLCECLRRMHDKRTPFLEMRRGFFLPRDGPFHAHNTDASIKLDSVFFIPQVAFFLFRIFFAPFFLPLSHAQLTGDQAELRRLRDNAEETMDIGDPQGAALNSGKAALMAKQETRPTPHAHFTILEALLRAQENVYRAIALFQQSGEQIPASSGVCGTLSLALTHQKKAETFLPSSPSEDPLFQNLPIDVYEWKETIGELQMDFKCRDNSSR